MVCPDDAPLAAQSARALLAKYREKAPTLEVAKYWAMCEWFDETCGQLLDFLDSRKLGANTLVIFLADNGWIQDPDRRQLCTRSKQSPYDGGLKDPDPGPLAWQGRATNLRSTGQRDRPGAHDSQGRRA